MMTLYDFQFVVVGIDLQNIVLVAFKNFDKFFNFFAVAVDALNNAFVPVDDLQVVVLDELAIYPIVIYDIF